MTISSTTRKAGPFIGTGLVSTFPFTFKVFQAADLLLSRADLTGTVSTLVLNTDYTVSLNVDQNSNPGGSVTLSSPLSLGYLLVVSSQVALLQDTHLANAGGFYPMVIEDALDKLTITEQQLAEQMGRALTIPITSAASTSMPAPSPTTLVGWDAGGTALTNYSASSLGVDITYAAWMTQLFNGDGSTTSCVLSADAGSADNCDVSVSGVTQRPNVDFTYTQATKTIQFTGTVPAGANNICVRYGQAVPVGIVPAGGVVPSSLSTGGPTWDASGNFGIGVTPSAWNSAYKAIQVNSGGVPFIAGSNSSSGSYAIFGVNSYLDAGAAWRYINSNYANKYEQYNGQHIWYIAPSGAAGNPITFTQAMTLDASGRLLVGATSGNTAQLQVSGNSGSTNNLNSLGPGALSISSTNPASAFGVAGRLFFGAGEDSYSQFASISGIYTAYSGGAGGGIVFSTAASGGSGSITERARIDAAGNLIQTVNSAAPSLSTNKTMTFELTNDTTLKIKVRGSDGVTRSATLTLA